MEELIPLSRVVSSLFVSCGFRSALVQLVALLTSSQSAAQPPGVSASGKLTHTCLSPARQFQTSQR